MRPTIDLVIQAIRVAQTHAKELETKCPQDPATLTEVDDIALALGWILKKLERLKQQSAAPT